MTAIISLSADRPGPASSPVGGLVAYEPPIEEVLADLAVAVAAVPALGARYRPRWLALQLLEGHDRLLADLDGTARARLLAALAAGRLRLDAVYGSEVDLAIADARYATVARVVSQAVTRPTAARPNLTERIDRVVLHKYLGIPLFLALLYLVFGLVQRVSAPYIGWLDAVISGPVTRWTTALLFAAGAPAWLHGLAVDGVIAGVGGVIVFLPGLLVLYFALALLEGSGYMTRGAFVIDRALSGLGLHGKSFMPLILGFGCNVPAVLATRIIEGRAARLLTGLLVPFMSCSARLPVYLVVTLAFFPQQAALIIWTLHGVGILVATLVGGVLARTLLRDRDVGTVVMELPPYRLPTPSYLLRQTWQHSAAFVGKAGTVILAAAVLLWVGLHLPLGIAQPRDSVFGQFSGAIAPAFAPAGFGTWQATGALLTGAVAKEVVISTLAQVYLDADTAPAPDPVASSLTEDLAAIVTGLGAATVAAGGQVLALAAPGVAVAEPVTPHTTLSAVLPQHFTPTAALAFLVCVLLYIPCVATVGAQVREYGWRWALLSMGLSLGVGWTAAVAVFQFGRLLGGA